MDPSALLAIAKPTVEILSILLTKRQAAPLVAEARSIVQYDPASSERVRKVFTDAKARLATTWKLGMAMAIALFVLFVALAILAVTTGILTGKSTYPIVLGGASGVSLLTVIIWKPYDKSFQATMTIQRLEMILVGLEELWATCAEIQDPGKRVSKISEANKAALDQMTKMAKA